MPTSLRSYAPFGLALAAGVGLVWLVKNKSTTPAKVSAGGTPPFSSQQELQDFGVFQSLTQAQQASDLGFLAQTMALFGVGGAGSGAGSGPGGGPGGTSPGGGAGGGGSAGAPPGQAPPSTPPATVAPVTGAGGVYTAVPTNGTPVMYQGQNVGETLSISQLGPAGGTFVNPYTGATDSLPADLPPGAPVNIPNTLPSWAGGSVLTYENTP